MAHTRPHPELPLPQPRGIPWAIASVSCELHVISVSSGPHPKSSIFHLPDVAHLGGGYVLLGQFLEVSQSVHTPALSIRPCWSGRLTANSIHPWVPRIPLGHHTTFGQLVDQHRDSRSGQASYLLTAGGRRIWYRETIQTLTSIAYSQGVWHEGYGAGMFGVSVCYQGFS